MQLPKFLLDFAKQKLAKSRGKFPRFHVLISKADFCIGFCVSFFCFYYYALIAHNENCWQQPTNQKVKSCNMFWRSQNTCEAWPKFIQYYYAPRQAKHNQIYYASHTGYFSIQYALMLAIWRFKIAMLRILGQQRPTNKGSNFLQTGSCEAWPSL